MSIPTHGVTCVTKTRPTNCPDCGVGVFYMDCTCGSKMFFDDLGYPWDLHTCRKYRVRQQVEMIKDLERLSDDAIYKIITDFEKRHGVEVDDTVLEMVTDIIGKRRYPLTVTRVEPGDPATDISGFIMELNDSINIYKKLGYDDSNPISVKLLGGIGKKKWARAIVRTRPNNRNECLEYEVFFTQDYLSKTRFRKNDFILGYANRLSHLKGDLWELKSHEIIR